MNINRRHLRRQHSTDGRLETSLFADEEKDLKPFQRAHRKPTKYAAKQSSPKVVKIELHCVVPQIPKSSLVVIAALCIIYGILSSLTLFSDETKNLPSNRKQYNPEQFSMKRKGRMRSTASTDTSASSERNNWKHTATAVDGTDHSIERNIPKRPSDDPHSRIPLPQPVRLLRIPKAGSSSFSAFLRYQYNCTSADFPPGDCTKVNRRVCSVVDGCYNHKPVPDWKRTPRSMMTFLRDPVARYISAYQYKGHHGLGTGNNITMHTILFPEYDNSQTNYLSRNPVGTWDLKHVGGNHRKANQARLSPPLHHTSDAEWEQRLQEASDLLKSSHLQFVGILEHWNDSLRLFCRIFVCNDEFLQKSLLAKHERQQSSSSRGPVYSDAAMRHVEASNAMDRRLYELAQKRFCEDIMKFRKDEEFMACLQKDTLDMCNAVDGTKSSAKLNSRNR